MKRIFLLFIFLVAFHLFLLANLRFTAWPEMLSYPYLLNNGFELYRDFIYPYPLLLTTFLANIYQFFGYDLSVVRVITWLLVAANDLLVFAIVQKLTKSVKFSALSLLFYVIVQPFLEGNQLWFDLVIVSPLLLATYYMLQKKYFWAGLFLVTAALIKQTTGIFLVVSSLYLVVSEKNIKNLRHILAAPFVLTMFVTTWLILRGTLTDFVNWVFVYPLTEWGKFPGYVQMSLGFTDLVVLVLLLLPVILFLIKLRTNFSKDKPLLLITYYLLLSFVLVYPRFSFFHLQAALAFLAILFGFVLAKVRVPNILLITYYLLLIIYVAVPATKLDWAKEARFYGKGDIALANLIKENVPEGKTVFLLGLHSGLYPMAQRFPPKPWTDNFGWYLEIPGVQEDIIGRWENPPDYVIWQEPKSGNWFDLQTYQPKKITNWIRKNYVRRKEVSTRVWLWEREPVLGPSTEIRVN